MKKFIIIAILFSGAQLSAQVKKDLFIPIDTETNKIKFQGVIKEEGDKYELFKRSIYWLNSFYKDPVRVTSVRDKETGKIVGRHRFRIYYWDRDRTDLIRVYNGYSLLSMNLDSNENPSISDLNRSSVNIYIKVIFSEEQIHDTFKFNIIQQGIHDQYGLILTKFDSITYYGDFKFYKDDGIFDVDGLGFVNVVYPKGFDAERSDQFDLTLIQRDVSAQIVFKEYLSGSIYKVLDINSFKQFYDVDDTNFMFGNPGVYKK